MSAQERGRERLQEAPIVPPPPGSVADLFREALPDVEFAATQGVLDVILTFKREELSKIMQAAKDDPRLAFDYLRCLSGVDQLEQGLEVVYHLYSFRHGHNVTIKTLLPLENPRVATVSHLWEAADWHEREAAEMFGILFEGHPNPAPLLLEEGLGYYPLRREHRLAEIEEHQEMFLVRGEKEAEEGEPA